MFLVTGAAGKTGRAVVAALVAQKEDVRALVYRPEHEESLRQLGAAEVMVGDMCAAATMAGAFQGISAVYHICPNMHPMETAIGMSAITAARAARCDRFVYHSVLHPQIEAMPHHWQKLRVEEQLFTSGLSYTILQPGAYMQNVLGNWHDLLEHGIYAVPYGSQTRMSLVDLQDVAEVAARVLREPGHAGATYELCGPEGLTQEEMADILQRQLRCSVAVQVASIEAWRKKAARAGLSDYQVDALVKMFAYYDRHGFCGNPGVLRWLLGRPPTRFADFVKREAGLSRLSL